MLKDDDSIRMRLKIDEVFEHYAAQSEYYQRANIAQRFKMEDAFYRLTMKCLRRLLDRSKSCGDDPGPDGAVWVALRGSTKCADSFPLD